MTTQQKHKRAELKDFGAYLRKRREQAGLSQSEAAKSITNTLDGAENRSGISVSQSLIAQLETGIARNPDEPVLRAIASVYGLRYAEIISELIKDKYNLETVRADRLKEDVRTVDELADWEKNAVKQTLWVVAPNFVDDHNSHVASTVYDLISKGIDITYFVDKKDLAPGTGRFVHFKSLIATKYRLENDKDIGSLIKAHPLGKEELAWLSTSFVIADPQQALLFAKMEEGEASGFYVMPGEGGQPAYGTAINRHELRRLAGNLMEIVSNHDSPSHE